MAPLVKFVRNNLVGFLALFVAMSAGAYAVTVAPKDSVVSKSIKNGQVKSVDVADDALTGADLQESTLQLPPGPTGAQGIQGPPGSQGVPGASGSPDTAAQVLAKLLGVDGAGSGVDADSLDGSSSEAFARLGGGVNGDGSIFQGSGFTVTHAGDGEYQVAFPAGTLSSVHCPPIVTAIPFSGLVRNPQLSGRGCSGNGAGSFTLKMLDAAGTPHDTPFLFIAM
jgi:hypothetical protein